VDRHAVSQVGFQVVNIMAKGIRDGEVQGNGIDGDQLPLTDVLLQVNMVQSMQALNDAKVGLIVEHHTEDRLLKVEVNHGKILVETVVDIDHDGLDHQVDDQGRSAGS